jgi:hypothetical protein
MEVSVQETTEASEGLAKEPSKGRFPRHFDDLATRKEILCSFEEAKTCKSILGGGKQAFM